MPNVYRIRLKNKWYFGNNAIKALNENYGMVPIQAGTFELKDPRTVEINGSVINFQRTEREHYVRFYNPGEYVDVGEIKELFRKNGNRGVKYIVNEREGHEYVSGTIGDVAAKKDRKAILFTEPHSIAYLEPAEGTSDKT